MKIKKLLLIILFVFCINSLAFAHQGKIQEEKTILPSEIGVVQSVEDFGDTTPSAEGELKQARQTTEIEIISGAHNGEKIIIDNNLMGNPAYDILLKPKDKVVLHVEKGFNGTDFFIADKYRAGALYFLTAIFCALLIIIGKKRGFFSLIAIGTTLVLIFFALTPMILSGMNPILATIFVCLLASVIAIYLVGGLNPKSTSALIGTVLSLMLGGGLSILTIKMAALTGFSPEQCLFLFSAHPEINLVGILASAMIIGALGAVMDIGMSIASTINELYLSNPDMSVKDLFNSGMNVGRDIIGMMANTLILAYIGSSLPLVLLSGSIDTQKFFNLNQVATEISSALIGSVALVLCVPITAVISAYLIKKIKPKYQQAQEGVEENHFDDIITGER